MLMSSVDIFIAEDAARDDDSDLTDSVEIFPVFFQSAVLHGASVGGRDKPFFGAKSIVAVASGVTLREVEAIKHMEFVVELLGFNDIKTHIRINANDTIELSHERMLTAELQLRQGLIRSARRRNIERLYALALESFLSGGNGGKNLLLLLIHLTAEFPALLRRQIFDLGVFGVDSF